MEGFDTAAQQEGWLICNEIIRTQNNRTHTPQIIIQLKEWTGASVQIHPVDISGRGLGANTVHVVQPLGPQPTSPQTTTKYYYS